MERTASSSHSKTLSYLAISVALITICSWISIPTAIPFTMQTFAVFAVLGLLGGKLGTLAIVCYLALGLVGLPVFAQFTSGPGILFGTTGGYLVGFVLMGLLYWLMTALLGTRPVVTVLALVLGIVVLYAFGSAWFLVLYLNTTGPVSLWAVLGWCVFPFAVPDLIKLSLALLLVSRVKPQLHL